MQNQNNFEAGCSTIINVCANMKLNQSVLIVTNEQTTNIGNGIAKMALTKTSNVLHFIIPEFTMHGQEPDDKISLQMLKSDIIISLTKKSMAHTKACHQALQLGAKYLSLADYSNPVIESPALQVDFKSLMGVSKTVACLLTNGNQLHITSKLGTNLKCDITGRKGNAAPGYCYDKGIIASPPDSEANIALIESGSNGVLVVDGSIPCDELGLLESPLKLDVKGGEVINITGNNSIILNSLFDNLNNPATRILAEFGLGLNPKAKLNGYMLEDEGTYGTIHIGIGANTVLGGQNSIPFHLDHIIKYPTVKIDNLEIMKNGKLNNKLSLVSTKN